MKIVFSLVIIGLINFGSVSWSATTGFLAETELYDQLQTGTNVEIENRLTEFSSKGLVMDANGTSAALLSSQCGSAGCYDQFVVTIPFRSSGANPTTEVLAAILSANATTRKARLIKVLPQSVVDSLITP